MKKSGNFVSLKSENHDHMRHFVLNMLKLSCLSPPKVARQASGHPDVTGNIIM